MPKDHKDQATRAQLRADVAAGWHRGRRTAGLTTIRNGHDVRVVISYADGSVPSVYVFEYNSNTGPK